VGRLLVRAIGRAGQERRGLRTVDVGRLCVWVDEVPAEPGRAALLEHHRVVESLGDCLPARFGTVVEGEAALRAMLGAREAELLARLDHLKGRRELAVTGLWTSEAAAEAAETAGAGGPGRRYMEQRRASVRREELARALAEEVARAAGSAEGEARHVVAPSPGVAFSSALLVGGEGAAETKRRLEALELAGVRLLVNGPWPPYTFAG
jgi:hypothetical protein